MREIKMAKSMQIMDFLKKSCFSDPPKYAKNNWGQRYPILY